MGYESRVSAWGWHAGSQEYIWQRKHSIGCYLGHSSPERKILEIKEHTCKAIQLEKSWASLPGEDPQPDLLMTPKMEGLCSC